MASHHVIKITSLKTDGDEVIVTFVDGVQARFIPYRHGWGYGVEGLRHFILARQDEEFFIYDARLYRMGPQDDENCIAKQPKDYDQRDAAAYWQAARDYLHTWYYAKLTHDDARDKALNDQYWYPWRVVCCEGGFDLNRLKDGKAPVKNETEDE